MKFTTNPNRVYLLGLWKGRRTKEGVGVEGHRDSAQLERAQEGGGEADAVMHEKRHAPLGLEAEPAEPAGRAVGERGELAERVRPLWSHDGRAGGQPLGERLVDQERGGVVDVQISHRQSE